MNKKIFFPLFIFIFFNVHAQPDLKFTRYTSENGLANNDVLSICQDNYGFIWFGTKDGCSRFDGTKFKTFQYDKNENGTIGPGWVNGIVCDKNNDLWLAFSGEGGPVMKYDYQKDIFIDMSRYLRKHLNYKYESINCWAIFCDSEGFIWIQLKSEEENILQINPDDNSIRTIKIEDSERDNHFAKSFFEDADKNIWLVGSKTAIYNREKGSFVLYKGNFDSENILGMGQCAFQDSQQHIWIGAKGLFKLSSPSYDNITIEQFLHDPDNPFSLSNDIVYGLAEDTQNNILIGTLNGLCLLDKKSKKIFRYYHDEIDPESINDNIIRCLYRDKHNTIWVGTSAGVGKLQTKNFKSYAQSLYKNSISQNKIQCISQALGSEVWIGTPKGIDIFDRKSGKFHLFADITMDSKGLYGAPVAMYNVANEGMWIGTWRGGFSYIDYKTDKITNYILQPATSRISHVSSIFPDSKNNLWLGVTNGPHSGVCVYNIKNKTLKNLDYSIENESSLSLGQITYMTEDSEGKIWLGTSNGLHLLTDFEKPSFKCFLKGSYINHIIESSDKSIWIGTNQGLYKYNKATQLFKIFDNENGLPSNKVISILEDQFNNLWITTDKGLSKFKLTENSAHEITNFRKGEGLRTGDFLPSSCAKLSDGAMIFGGSKGFCLFYPDKVIKDTVPPTVVFTNLKIANKNVKVSDTINNQVILPQSIITTKQLVLNHKNNELTIEFAGLQYNMPEYNSYAYKLAGNNFQDYDWQYTDADDREVEYMNLPAGDYTFSVKAANSYNVWNNQPTELKIKVLPPWWQTLWFKTLLVTLLIFSVFLAIRIRTNSLQKQKRKLKQLVEKRTEELKEMNFILSERSEELEQQMEQLARMNEEIEKMAKQLHDADQSKLQFFANISHEFRTPLTLIIGPLEKYLNLPQPVDWDRINIRNYLQLMHKNSKRLLNLINQIIDFRKIDSGEKKLSITSNNIVKFVKDVIQAFSTLIEQKNINVQIESQYPVINFWFDVDVMEKILYNLISNAIKYTQRGGNVSIQLSVTNSQIAEKIKMQKPAGNNNQSSITIKVSDSGIGIKEENLIKIFDRFYRVETNETLKEEGTGIGLSYTKELVELHKGKIYVESTYGKGSSFMLNFPLEKAYFNDVLITENQSGTNLDYINSMMSVSDNIKIEQPFVLQNEKEWERTLTEKNSTILLVEDNNDLRKFINDELAEHYKIYEAENGKDGLKMALEIQPDLIISDIMMPVMDGKEFCKKIKTSENTSHIPVILLTAKEGEENIIKGLEIGANDYITKPFNINVLKIKIKNLFILQKQIQEKFNESMDVLPEEISVSPIDQQFMKKAFEVVKLNIHNFEFDNNAFINQMNHSRALVYKKMKNITGLSVSEFIHNIRIKAAAKYFIKGHKNISEVAYKVGFKHQSVFTRHFKNILGVSPRQFIKERLGK